MNSIFILLWDFFYASRKKNSRKIDIISGRWEIIRCVKHDIAALKWRDFTPFKCHSSQLRWRRTCTAVIGVWLTNKWQASMQSELNFTRFDGETAMMLIEFSSKKSGSMKFCKTMFYMLIDFFLIVCYGSRLFWGMLNRKDNWVENSFAYFYGFSIACFLFIWERYFFDTHWRSLRLYFLSNTTKNSSWESWLCDFHARLSCSEKKYLW